MNKRIGLITIYHVPNYGSVLQAFATQKIIESNGYYCDIINYKYPNEWHWKNGAKRPNKLKAFIRYFYPSKKDKVLTGFRNRYFHFTKRFNSLEDLQKAEWNKYCAFVVGSDQVWNYKFTKGDSVFLLSFVPKQIPRFSLSSSFAVNTLPLCFREKYRKELCNFAALSVREENGIQIIRRELRIEDTPVHQVLDPTLLLSREEWLNIIPRSRFKKKNSYILFYMWDYAFDPKPYIFEVTKFFQQKMNCEVIALEGFCNSKITNGLEMKDHSWSSIPEFIDLFANADLVITSSFHGTAFALNFGIPLLSIVPGDEGDDRQTTLIRKLGVDNCRVNIGDDIELLSPHYDQNIEQEILNRLRNNNFEIIRQWQKFLL